MSNVLNVCRSCGGDTTVIRTTQRGRGVKPIAVLLCVGCASPTTQCSCERKPHAGMQNI